MDTMFIVHDSDVEKKVKVCQSMRLQHRHNTDDIDKCLPSERDRSDSGKLFQNVQRTSPCLSFYFHFNNSLK